MGATVLQYLKRPLSPAMWARALLLWGILALGALLLGIAALWMGSYIKDNVTDELAAQQITFPAADQLTDEERAIDGMEAHAGEALDTGDEAKIYSEYILLHLHEAADNAGYPGATYATLGPVQRDLRTQVQQAHDAGNQQAEQAAQAELDTVTTLRNTMLTGSNLRANLLSAYGWDNVGTGVLVVGVGILVLALIFALLYLFEWRRGHVPEAVTAAVPGDPAGAGTARPVA